MSLAEETVRKCSSRALPEAGGSRDEPGRLREMLLYVKLACLGSC